MKISLTVLKLYSGYDYIIKNTMGHKLVKYVRDVMVLVLRTSSDHALYIYTKFYKRS